ncbi:SOS response-associated peptidase [Herbaspirillum sp. WGmk3]|jgi:putative SOS response-associated peptidase YedK|uniref:Abasic site processing protein n=3 Tax=Pseudomonadota TaxID=1224 RepID=A0AAJ2LWR7_9BURK|nr:MULTISPECIES: SOS response-associated peptidase family protein [Herbaspirillum]MCO4855619.1 SOS response-associated peptidase [Herbaspirillum sp. WGmk3]MDR9838366.1 SOS response-associated peptidase family protein [Herbaspirillum huttiense]UWE15182.1 SOS response-associated peptidase [Herbaspirillum huttiense]
MCVNYKPTPKSIITALTGADTSATPDWPEETWQDYAAPVVRAGLQGEPELIVGTYGMMPRRKLQGGLQISTMNARAETIGEKRSYAGPWRAMQTCLLPMHWFYEPNYEGGRPQRWAIGMADDQPFCVAGLWRAWEEPEGGYAFSFTQITINADAHPLMNRFHKPGEEKRNLVIIPPADYADWLNVGDTENARRMLVNYPASAMKAWPAPKSEARSSSGQGSLLF